VISAKLAGAVILGVPLLLVAWVLLRRQARAVFWFAVALILVGLGYLAATGATDDIARRILPGSALQVLG
jgi:dipeptide/tripeptide permease